MLYAMYKALIRTTAPPRATTETLSKPKIQCLLRTITKQRMAPVPEAATPANKKVTMPPSVAHASAEGAPAPQSVEHAVSGGMCATTSFGTPQKSSTSLPIHSHHGNSSDSALAKPAAASRAPVAAVLHLKYSTSNLIFGAASVVGATVADGLPFAASSASLGMLPSMACNRGVMAEEASARAGANGSAAGPWPSGALGRA
mmetsp:Transcript_71622/g.219348  ORF Transcript_71622/g.219348 Transcript_71622/m.219348 type:complete len:201 (+) Transcript_71622:955-1557(+)